jgi:3-deoxy-7-phosphoheptulonate synthase
MIIVCSKRATEAQIKTVADKIRGLGLELHRSDGVEHTILGLVGDRGKIDSRKFLTLPGVRDVLAVSSPYKLASRDFHPEDTIVDVGEVHIGGSELVVIAGPCAVESQEQILETAKLVKAHGARILRGGAFKPRTSPYSFQGLGEDGLRMLRKSAEEFGLAVVTEVMTINQIGLVAEYSDLLQVGARNMQNFPLLTELGASKKPILLKRGLSATVQDWLMSAEYILSSGNPDVILCERGIRTFETATRNTLDISSVPVVKQLSHLPIIVDPSHGVGDRRYVAAMARAAVAAGADGIMVEVHPNPDSALSDGPQSLTPDQFAALVNRCRIIGTTLGRRISKGKDDA